MKLRLLREDYDSDISNIDAQLAKENDILDRLYEARSQAYESSSSAGKISSRLSGLIGDYLNEIENVI